MNLDRTQYTRSFNNIQSQLNGWFHTSFDQMEGATVISFMFTEMGGGGGGGNCSNGREYFFKIITARQRSCRNVIYSVVIVRHSVHKKGVGSQVTITHGPPQPPCTPDMGLPRPAHQTWDHPPQPLAVTSGGHHWRRVQTCSLEDPTPTSTDIWWPLKHIPLVVGILEGFVVIRVKRPIFEQ